MPKAHKLSSGGWGIRVILKNEIVYGPDGEPERYSSGRIKRQQVSEYFSTKDPSPAGRREIERQAVEYLASHSGEDKAESLTVKEAVKRYIDVKTPVLSGSTIRAYISYYNTRFNEIGGERIDRITADKLQSWINILAADHSPKTVKNVYSLFLAASTMYGPDKVYRVTLPKKVKKEKVIPTDAQIKALIKESDGPLLRAIYLGAFCGLRRGEICALTQDDVNGDVLTVNKSCINAKDGIVVNPFAKTEKGNRRVIMPTFVADAVAGVDGYIVPFTPNGLTKSFDRAAERAGIEGITFHSLRHYSSSIMHAIGLPDIFIQARGGWSSDVYKTTYRHVMSDREKGYNDVINGYFETLLTDDVQ